MLLVVGRVLRPHGVRGEVSVQVRTDDPDYRFAPGARLQPQRPGSAPPASRSGADLRPVGDGTLTVRQARVHHGRLLVTFDEVDDREAAQALAGTLLVADSASSRPVTDGEEFWDHDLVGLPAVDPAGEPLGLVSDVLHGPGGDTLVLELAGGREALVPFVRAIVPEVDPATGRLVVDAPPGLLDL